MRSREEVLREFMPCGGAVCRGCEVSCTHVDGRTPDADAMADRIRELEGDAKRLEFMALNGFALSSLTRDGVRFFRASVAHTWVHDWRLAIDHADAGSERCVKLA